MAIDEEKPDLSEKGSDVDLEKNNKVLNTTVNELEFVNIETDIKEVITLIALCGFGIFLTFVGYGSLDNDFSDTNCECKDCRTVSILMILLGIGIPVISILSGLIITDWYLRLPLCNVGRMVLTKKIIAFLTVFIVGFVLIVPTIFFIFALWFPSCAFEFNLFTVVFMFITGVFNFFTVIIVCGIVALANECIRAK